MTTNTRTIIPIDVPAVAPIKIAMACYLKWKTDVPFVTDLAHYLEEGCVISRPDIFAMAKIIELPSTLRHDGQRPKDGEPAQSAGWFIRMAVGPLDRLLAVLPVRLPKICFCRRNDGRMRVYSLDRLLKLTNRR